jgi:hypothetical protein
MGERDVSEKLCGRSSDQKHDFRYGGERCVLCGYKPEAVASEAKPPTCQHSVPMDQPCWWCGPRLKVKASEAKGEPPDADEIFWDTLFDNALKRHPMPLVAEYIAFHWPEFHFRIWLRNVIEDAKQAPVVEGAAQPGQSGEEFNNANGYVWPSVLARELAFKFAEAYARAAFDHKEE